MYVFKFFLYLGSRLDLQSLISRLWSTLEGPTLSTGKGKGPDIREETLYSHKEFWKGRGSCYYLTFTFHKIFDFSQFVSHNSKTWSLQAILWLRPISFGTRQGLDFEMFPDSLPSVNPTLLHSPLLQTTSSQSRRFRSCKIVGTWHKPYLNHLSFDLVNPVTLVRICLEYWNWGLSLVGTVGGRVGSGFGQLRRRVYRLSGSMRQWVESGVGDLIEGLTSGSKVSTTEVLGERWVVGLTGKVYVLRLTQWTNFGCWRKVH